MSRLNYLATGYDITDEIIKRSSSASLPLAHDTIRGSADLELWTGPGRTGTELALDTDYTLGAEDATYTAKVGVTTYTKFAVINGAYHDAFLYVTYKTIGDYSSAESISRGSGAVGDIKPWPYHRVQDENWEWADGASLTRATYPEYFERACAALGVCTVSIASPGVVTCAGHGLITGDCVFLETTGALLTGITANTMYYVIYVSSSTFRLATSRALADAGTAINTSGSQSGVHTLRACPFGIDSATTFLKPDLREVAITGVGTRAAGVEDHDVYRDGEFKDDQGLIHQHTLNIFRNGGSGSNIVSLTTNQGGTNPGTSDPLVDGVAGRFGTVNRGKRIGMKFVVRVL